MLYLYYCPHCDQSFEIRRGMEDVKSSEECPQCGQRAGRKYTAIPFTFGWRLTEHSHDIGNHPDELERDI